MAHLEDRQGRGGLRWRVRWRDPEHRWHSKSFAKKSEAERWLHKLATDLDAGTYSDPARGRVPVGEIAEAWYRSHAPLLKVSTATAYRGVLDRLVLPRWGRVYVQQVTYVDVASWVGDLATSGISSQRVRHAHGILAQVLDHAVADRRLPTNPARGVKLPPLPDRLRHRYLTHSELLRLAVASGHARPLVMVLGYTGLRWGEAVGLRVGDLNPETRRLQIDRALVEVRGKLQETSPKTHKRRSVPVPSIVMDSLASRLGADPSELLLPAPKGGPYRSSNFRTQVWHPTLERAEIPPLRVHDLRHTAASLAVSAGGNVLAIARMLGHRDPSITLRVYSDLFDSDLDDVARRMDDAARAVLVRPHDAPRGFGD